MGRVRVGVPTTPTITTTGTPGSSDQVRTFVDSYTRPCFITNTDTSEALYILVNEDGASPTNFMVKLAALQSVDISVDSQINVASVSLYYPTVAYSNAQVRGWRD